MAENKAVQLVDVDELSKHIQETIEQRKKEIPKAEKIIKEMTKEFLDGRKEKENSHRIFISSKLR